MDRAVLAAMESGPVDPPSDMGVPRVDARVDDHDADPSS
jgi:hypothetical protein